MVATMDGIEASPALARAVRARRAELRLSREQLAGHLGWEKGTSYRVGWSPRTIVRIERGERGLEEAERFRAFARALKLTPAQLAARVESADPALGELLVPPALAELIERLEPDAAQLVEQILTDLAALVARLPQAGESQNGG